MRKNFFLAFALAASSFIANAQLSITNGNFEQWQNVGNNTEEPTNWNSNKTGGGNATSGPQTCFRESNNPHTGTYCARVKSGSTLGIVVNGSLTTGKVEAPSFSKADGYIRTIPTDPNYNMPFTGRPDSLVFWLRYTPGGSDRVRLEARLHVGFAYAPEAPNNNNHPDSTVNIIARAQFLSANATISNWTRFSLPFVYVDSRTPQYILITSTPSHDQTAGNSNSTMWLDDISVVYNPVVGAVNTASTYYVSNTVGSTIDVPFTLTGPYDAGNTAVAQLSDANGSFANAINIGSVTATASGTINATIPAGTPSGTGYKIRVVASNPGGISNNTSGDVNVVLVNAAVTPASSQSILAGVDGNILTVTENFTATSREWKFSTTSGTGYQSFATAETGTTYTPNFQNNGTYYVVCESEFNGLTTTSNEVQISVNSITLTTGTIIPEFLDFSASAPDTTFDVPYTTSGDFNNGNTFSVQLSDASGSFANPTVIGTVAAINSGVVSATIPSTTATGIYRVRVVASDPEIFGNDNGTDISIDQFAVTIAPATTQTLLENETGAFINATESQDVVSREWRVSTTSGSGYQPFSPAETSPSYVPLFAQNGTYYVVCASTNSYNDEVLSNEVTIDVTIGVGIDENSNEQIKIWNAENLIMVDLTATTLVNPYLVVYSLEGKEVLRSKVNERSITTINAELNKGIYIVRVYENHNIFSSKIVKQ